MHIKDLTPDWLIKSHFFGLYEEDSDGKVFLPNPQNKSQRIPDEVIQEAIDAAIARLESSLDVSIRGEEQITEWHDYDYDLYTDYCFVALRKYPTAALHSMQLVYGENGSTIWDIPSELLQTHGFRSKFGMVQVLPLVGVISAFDPAYSLFLPGTLQARRAPSMLKVVYDSGLDLWKHPDGSKKGLPYDLVRGIGLLAAIHPLNILGDLVIGAGIAAVSTNVDGISQSVETTASAENAAFSARIIMHRKELYGEQGQPGLYHALEKQWRRNAIALL